MTAPMTYTNPVANGWSPPFPAIALLCPPYPSSAIVAYLGPPAQSAPPVRPPAGRSPVTRRSPGPAFPGDPQYPYVGKYVKDLTLAQVETLDCGKLTRPDMPQQRSVPGTRVPRLGDDLAGAARSVGATAIPVHGNPQNGSIDDPGYQPFTTAKMIPSARRRHMLVFPWTVDDEPTMRALIAGGADGIDTDYPDRLRKVGAEAGYRLPPKYRPAG